jgi:hypothetical protein
MVVLPKGTLVKVGEMPFRLLADVETDGLQSNYELAMNPGPVCGGQAAIGAPRTLAGGGLEVLEGRVRALEQIVHTNLSANAGGKLEEISLVSMPGRDYQTPPNSPG